MQYIIPVGIQHWSLIPLNITGAHDVNTFFNGRRFVLDLPDSRWLKG